MKNKLRQLKSNPFGLAIWVLMTAGFYVLIFGAGLRGNYTMGQRVLWTILAVAFTLPVHELLHALAAKLLCRGKVSIELAKDPVGIWSLRTVFPGGATPSRLIVIYLLPFLVLTVLPTLYLLWIKPTFFLFIAAVANCAGTYFDLLDTAILICRDQHSN